MSDSAPITMEDVTAAVGVLHAGDRAAGRARLTALWARRPSAALRCVLAHYLADTQDDAAEELRWDLAALAAADEAVQSGETELMSGLTVGGFYPSLYLNASDASLRAGDAPQARRWFGAGMAALDVLPDTPYGATVRDAFARLGRRIAAAG